jgi:hypothetical protein
MKQLLILLLTIALYSCSNKNETKMENLTTEKVGTIELVIFKTMVACAFNAC